MKKKTKKKIRNVVAGIMIVIVSFTQFFWWLNFVMTKLFSFGNPHYINILIMISLALSLFIMIFGTVIGVNTAFKGFKETIKGIFT